MPFMEGTILESGAGRSIFDRSGKGLAGTAIRRRAAGRTACGIGRQRGREAADLRHPAERRASAEKTAWRKRPRSCRKGMCRAREKLTKFAGKGKMGGEWGCGRGAGPVPQVFCRAGRAQQRRADENFFRRRYFGKYSGRKALSTGRFGKDGPSRGESAPGDGACFREEERGTPRAGGSAERCPFRRLCGESAAPGQGRKKTSEERNSPDVLSERTERPSEGHVFLRKSVSLPPFRGGAEKTRRLRISPRACVPRGCPRRPPRRPRRC